jgi:hypothetical protein
MTAYNYREVYETLDNGLVADNFPDFDKYKKHFQKAENKYPQLDVNIQPEDVAGLINKHGLLSFTEMKTQTEKLLYSVLWKQGDLPKVKHIVEGISGKPTLSNKKSGLIFYQFGRYLANNHEPIIDRHVIKAYECYRNSIDLKGLSKKSKEKKLAQDYIKWFSELSLNNDERFIADRIMFAIGKHLNSKKSK